MVPNHGHATSGWSDDVFELFEDGEKFQSEWFCILHAAGVGHRLPAAGLLEGEFDFDSVPLENAQRGDSDLWIELIDIAGDEQADLHRKTLPFQQGIEFSWGDSDYKRAVIDFEPIGVNPGASAENRSFAANRHLTRSKPFIARRSASHCLFSGRSFQFRISGDQTP